MHGFESRGSRSLHAIAALASGLVLASPAALAAPITLNLSVELGRFIDVVGTQAAPIGAFSANFTISFDTEVTTAATSAGLTVNSLSFVPDSALQFRYNAGNQTLTIGGANNGPNNIALGTSDLVLQILMSDPLAPTLHTCASDFNCGTANGNADVFPSGYTLDNSPGHGWLATLGSVSATAVPEPASLALGGLALAGLAWTRRRRPALPTPAV